MKKLTICFLFLAFLAFGQKAEKMDRRAAAQAWALVSLPLPPDLPSISGGGLIVEKETNGANFKIRAVYSNPGTYLVIGDACDGKEFELGAFQFEPGPHNPRGSSLVFDSAAMVEAAPFFPRICSVGMIRIDGGLLQRLVAQTDPWGPYASAAFPVGGEGITPDGKYYISLLPLPEGVVVILGRGVIAEEIQRSPAGSIAVFPQVGMPPPGPTTITICAKGQCVTATFERKVVVEQPNNGKG